LYAIANGKGLDATLGLTVFDGLGMGMRCGSLDPGVVLYLAPVHGMSTEPIEDMLYHGSGLLGISGISGDMRDLMTNSDARASRDGGAVPRPG
jgi:acetate kinase